MSRALRPEARRALDAIAAGEALEPPCDCAQADCPDCEARAVRISELRAGALDAWECYGRATVNVRQLGKEAAAAAALAAELSAAAEGWEVERAKLRAAALRIESELAQLGAPMPACWRAPS